MSDRDLWTPIREASRKMVLTIAETPLSPADKAHMMAMLSSFFVEQTVMAIEASRGHLWTEEKPAPEEVRYQGRQELFDEFMQWAKDRRSDKRFIRRPAMRDRN